MTARQRGVLRFLTGCTVALAWLVTMETAVAAPNGLRNAIAHPGPSVEIGSKGYSLTMWPSDKMGLGLNVGARGERASLSIGTTHWLWRSDGLWGARADLSGGVEALFTDPGIAVLATPSIALVRQGPAAVAIGLVAPTAFRLNSPELRLPILAETHLGTQSGQVSWGVRGAIGAIYTPGAPIASALEWSVWAALPW